MQTISRTTFTTVKTEGALLPADLLQRIAEGHGVEGLRPEDYHLLPGERLNEAINRAWNRCLGAWQAFDAQRVRLPETERGTTLTRERWLLVLFQELGYGRLQYAGSLPLNAGDPASPAYPISHCWEHTPIHLVSFHDDLERRGVEKRSSHSLLQEFLNRAEGYLWGFVSNGLRLRILRDNASLTRAAYVEFDLEVMMAGELYADFALLWLVCHQSRVEIPPSILPSVAARGGDREGECWLERWSKTAAEQGARALGALRDGVQEAISALGRGFLAHPANRALKAKLCSGELGAQDYYRQLLRLVYRLIFLFAAEDRDLLLLPGTGNDTGNGTGNDTGDGTGDSPSRPYGRPYARPYTQYYSLRRLREMAGTLRGGPHADLYRSLRLTIVLLRDGYPALGLPALGSFLFSERATPDLDQAELPNSDLLISIRALAFTIEGKVRRPVDYKNLGSIELGSVYESLLELHPQLNADAAIFDLQTGAGNERKTTGSHYTPPDLVNELIESALEPVIQARLKAANDQRPPTAAVGGQPSVVNLEQALLSIKLCDSASGSGHFLVAGAYRLARHLARVRTGDEEPSPQAIRAALRDVVGRCIYGVDINPMAVELCKVSLWLEALEPGKPLSFLDHHIQCGNSLIGATPALLEAGIPDEAFTPIEGDDKKICAEFKKKNKAQRAGGQLSMFAHDLRPWERLGDVAASMMSLDDMADSTIEDVRRKQERYEQLVRSSDYEYGLLWADAWCAAFVWKKTSEFAYPITEDVFRQIERNPFSIPVWMREEIKRLAEQYQFFHWHLAFPDVFRVPGPNEESENGQTGWSGGFDCILGNPPWEMVELSEKEFFAVRASDIATASTARQRDQMIEALQEENLNLYGEFVEAKRSIYAYRKFVQDSGRFPYSAIGRINLYPLFVEASVTLVSPKGYTGLIVPSAISMDAYNAPLFAWLVANHRFRSLFDFENRGIFFPQVHRSYRFCLLTLCGSEIRPTQLRFFYFGGDVSELKDERRRIVLTPSEIDMFSPNTFSPPMLLNAADERLAKSAYGSFGVLVNRKNENNLWRVSVQRMLSLSDPGDLFRKITELSEQDIEEANSHWVRLYSGKAIYQFDHRFATYVGAEAEWREVSAEEHADPHWTIKTEYYARQSAVNKRLEGKLPSSWLMVYRDITRATDKRSVMATILPPVGCDTTSRNIFSDYSPIGTLTCLLGNLNSFVLNYFARQKIIGIHLNAGILEQLPVLPPDTYGKGCPWSTSTLVSDWIRVRIIELTYTAWDLQPFAQDCGYAGPPFRWDEERRFLLHCELDATYFHLYGIARDDVDYIIDTFPIVKRKDEAAYGEYRTKRVILEIYDAIQKATESGKPYQTLLDPPPADARVAHKE